MRDGHRTRAIMEAVGGVAALLLLVVFASVVLDGGQAADPHGAPAVSSSEPVVAVPPAAIGGGVEDGGASSAEVYEQLVQRELEPGLIAYSPPDEMEVGDRVTVTARITREDADRVSDELFEGLSTEGASSIETEELQVGTVMRAVLEGEGFQIQRIGPEEQMLRQSGHRQWQWRVEALRSGTWPLYLTVYASYEGQDIDSVTLNREIPVSVSPLRAAGGFFSRHWQWLVSTLLGSGVLAWAARAVQRRSKGRRGGGQRAAPTAAEPGGVAAGAEATDERGRAETAEDRSSAPLR